jgi:hypothetical protein
VNLRLGLARLYLPARLRKRKLEELLRLTARAFDAPAPDVGRLSIADVRRVYAEFSRTMAERALARPADLETVRRRLFDEAERLGREIRAELRVSTPREVMTAALLLYRELDIHFEGDDEGRIVMQRCFFSRVYSAEVCRLISRLDAGLLAGLAGGGVLEFSERLTEGAGCCRARFTFPGAA